MDLLIKIIIAVVFVFVLCVDDFDLNDNQVKNTHE